MAQRLKKELPTDMMAPKLLSLARSTLYMPNPHLFVSQQMGF